MPPSALNPFDYVRDWKNLRSERGWWHSFELPNGDVIEGVCDLASLKGRIAQFPIPQDLSGKRVLDIGAWDGWFSFEMERRGAEVLAIDNWDNPRFHEMHAMLNSRVEYRQIDMYDLTPERVGRFDVVLFMGVLYHLKHPLLALERVCALTTDMAAIDSFVIHEEHRPGTDVESQPVMEFYEAEEFGGQTDNWVGPSVACLLAFCRTAGFARVELQSLLERSACVACYRKWDVAGPGRSSPELLSAVHNRNHGINFDSRHDEYVSAWFRWEAARLTCDDVKPEVGGFGVRPISLSSVDANIWQADFKLPPGLPAGWHQVCMRIANGPCGSAKRIAVDLALEPAILEIVGVKDGAVWTPDRIDLRQGNAVSLWVKGLPEHADRNNLRAWVSGHRAEIVFLAESDHQSRQINIQVPVTLAAGAALVEIALGSQPRVAASIEVLI